MRSPFVSSLRIGVLILLVGAPLALLAQDTRPVIGPELPPNMRNTRANVQQDTDGRVQGRALDNSADSTVPGGMVLGANLAPGVMAEAALKFETTFVDFGDMDEGKTETARFPFKNNSDRTVTITNTQTTCGCTVAKLDKKVFPPGEGDTVEIAFNSTGRPGLNDRVIRIMTDEPGVTSYAVRLRANVTQDVWLSQRVAGFGEVPVGENKTITINLNSIAETPLEIMNVQNPRGEVRVDVGNPLPYAAPGKSETGMQIPVNITIPGDRPAGRVSGNIVLHTNQPGQHRTLSIIYSGNVVGAVTYSPARLDFGVVPPNSKQMTRGSLSVTTGDGVFELESWEVLPLRQANQAQAVTPAEQLPRLSITVEKPTDESTVQSLVAVAEIPEHLGHLQGTLTLNGKIGDKAESIQIPFSVYVRDMPALQQGMEALPVTPDVSQRRPVGSARPGS